MFYMPKITFLAEPWRQNVRDVGVSAADGAIVALTEELAILGKELPKEKIQNLELEIRKLVRQTVFNELCPKTHMD